MKDIITIDGVTYKRVDETKEEPKYKVGDWIFTDEYKKALLKITKICGVYFSFKTPSGSEYTKMISSLGITHATPSEIESHLIEEAKRRGYKKGTTIKSIADYQHYTLCDDHFSYEPASDSLHGSNYTIYWNGKWSEIINDEAIRIGGYDVVFEDNNVKVGCKSFSKSDLAAIRYLSNMSKREKFKIEFDKSGHIHINDGDGLYHVSKTDVDNITDKALF